MQMDVPEENECQQAAVLDDCLEAMLAEDASLDDCLIRYPEYAQELKDLLVAASRFNHFNNLEPSPAFRNRTRTELVKFIRSQKTKPVPLYRYGFILASLVIGFLTTGTALAQGALPGDRLYEWKLASERAWRWTAADPVGVDIKLAERRTREVLAVMNDPERSLRAWQEYQNAESQLISEMVLENEDRITSVIQSQRDSLEQSGIKLPPVKEIPLHQPGPEIKPPGPKNLQMPTQVPSSVPIVTMIASPELMSTAIPTLMPPIETPEISTPN